MVATLVGLKLRLLRNGYRSRQTQIAVGAFSTFALMALAGLLFSAVVFRARPEYAAPWIILIFSVSLVLWITVPLLVGMTDGAIDPARLSHLPVGGPRLVVALMAASAVGIVPGFFLAGLLVLVVGATSVGQVFFTVAAAVTLLSMCVVTAQVGSNSMSGLLRGRRTRDVAAAVLAVIAMSTGLFFQFGMRAVMDSSLEQQWAVARWLRWTPGGWVGQAVAWSRAGDWPLAFLGLASGWLFTALMGFAWWRLLQRLLTTTEQMGGANASTSKFIPFFVRWLPGGEGTHAAVARSLRSIRRDPREWANITSQLPLLLVVGFPVAEIDSNEVVLFTGAAGIYGGMLNSNLFGMDGRAMWIDQLSAHSMASVIWGKTVAHALIVVPILAAGVIGLALWKDGWQYAIQGIALAIASFGAITGAVSVASIRYALPLPEGANPFAGQGTGQSASQGFLLLGSLLVGFLLSLPAVGLVVGASLYKWWVGILVCPIAVLYGLHTWRKGVHAASREATADGPELLERLTLRS